MHEKRFEGDVARLRSPERVERLEVERVTGLCLEGQEFATLLDVGTGSGLFAEAFSKLGLEVWGLDANAKMVTVAGKFVPGGNFRVGTAEALPYPDASFDLAFLGLVLHESDEPLKALQEARRVAKKQVCILEWPYREQSFGPPLADRLNPEDLVALFRKAGYRKWQSFDLSNTIFHRLER